MMCYDKYNYKIICEDKTHYSFILQFLKHYKVSLRRIKLFDGYPNGKMDAKRHVKNCLEKVKEEYRSIQASAKTMYIVVRDVDLEDYTDVRRDMDCEKFSNIFLVLPKRNMETWLYFLTNPGVSIDESRDMKNRYEYRMRECIKNYFDMTDENLKNAPPSLVETVSALKECERIRGK